MIIYLYKDELCDPLNNVGTCRQFNNSKDIDSFIQAFVASMTPRSIKAGKFRIFITDDNTSFEEMDHHVAMNGEKYTLDMFKTSIEEIDIKQVAMHVNDAYKETERKKNVGKRNKH